ncbi:unnamed protein product [Tenebrio molitor]|nr:unnamed protein product [Tenebrio molitor]
MFGKIIKRRASTNCHNDVKAIFYNSNFHNDATEYGKIHEKHALEKFSLVHGCQIKPSGLFIDLQYGFLGASPDGLVVGENGLVEVKCLYFVAKTGLSLKEAILQKNICLEMNGSGFRLKRKHNYIIIR